MRRLALLLTLLLTLASGCLSKNPYSCASDLQCQQNGMLGFCESVGYCSFTSTDCPSGRQFGDLSGPYANVCVDGATQDAGPDSSVDSGITIPGCWAEIAVGDYFTCARKSSGQVWCWGNDDYRQVGQSDEIYHSTPVQVNNITDATHIVAGGEHACALTASGSPKCWGSNNDLQLGSGSQGNHAMPQTLGAPLVNALQISGGYQHTCAVASDRTVYCWGYNDHGQTGDLGSSLHGYTTPPFQVPGVTTALQVGAGGDHACALTATGILCWGANYSGQLGLGTGMTDANLHAPTAPMLTGNFTEIAVGDGHVCARKDDGTLWCWGENATGELGNGNQTDNPVPQPVPGIANVVHVTAHQSSTCVLLANNDAYCWGADSYGQLGDGQDTYDVLNPVKLASNVAQVVPGAEHICVLMLDGSIKCIGDDGSGQLGDGALLESLVPVQVTGLTDATYLAAGWTHVCVNHPSNTMGCWGENSYGAYGDGTETQQTAPGSVTLNNAGTAPFGVVSSIAAGNNFTCAVDSGNAPWCWGYNSEGEEGTGNTNLRHKPQAVSTLTGVQKIAAGYDFSCALKTDGTVACWGYNSDGQIGNNMQGTNALAPATVPIDGVVDIAAGGGHVCVIKTGGTTPATPGIYCWGANDSGQLGVPKATTSSAVPVQAASVTGPPWPVQIGAGNSHTCIRYGGATGGTVSCWGDNYEDELGNGMNNSGSYMPGPVSGLSDAIDLSVLAQTSCAVKYSGGVVCWGWNDIGQIGDGTAGPSAMKSLPTPTAVALPNVIKVARGYQFTCGMESGGKVWCWGANDNGELGQGTLLKEHALTPSMLTCP
jgi:alpha-tubulin suppressor-like RCC1 family protein